MFLPLEYNVRRDFFKKFDRINVKKEAYKTHDVNFVIPSKIFSLFYANTARFCEN
jgi:hypothetical protein